MDGYNVIFAWDSLREIANGNLDAARQRLMDILCNYAGYRQIVPILVFDAYKVKGGEREVRNTSNSTSCTPRRPRRRTCTSKRRRTR